MWSNKTAQKRCGALGWDPAKLLSVAGAHHTLPALLWCTRDFLSLEISVWFLTLVYFPLEMVLFYDMIGRRLLLCLTSGPPVWKPSRRTRCLCHLSALAASWPSQLFRLKVQVGGSNSVTTLGPYKTVGCAVQCRHLTWWAHLCNDPGGWLPLCFTYN